AERAPHVIRGRDSTGNSALPSSRLVAASRLRPERPPSRRAIWGALSAPRTWSGVGLPRGLGVTPAQGWWLRRVCGLNGRGHAPQPGGAPSALERGPEAGPDHVSPAVSMKQAIGAVVVGRIRPRAAPLGMHRSPALRSLAVAGAEVPATMQAGDGDLGSFSG